MNQVKEAPSPVVVDIIKNAGIEFAGTIPEDETIYAYDMNGKPTVEIPEETPALKAAYTIFEKIIR
jgi:CO dehydrogenase maturation factor